MEPCCPHYPSRSHLTLLSTPTWALRRARWPRRVAAIRREGGGALLPTLPPSFTPPRHSPTPYLGVEQGQVAQARCCQQAGGGRRLAARGGRLPGLAQQAAEGRLQQQAQGGEGVHLGGGGQEGDTSFDRLLILRSERIVCPPAVRPRAVRPHAYPACSAPPNPSPAYTPHTSLLPPLSLSLSLSLPLPPSLPPFFLSPSPSLTHLQHRLLPLLSGIDGNQARRPVSVEGARVQQGVRQRHLGLGPAIPCQDVGHTGRGGDTVWVWGSEGGSKLDGRGGRTIRACMQQHSRCSYSPVPTALTCTL